MLFDRVESVMYIRCKEFKESYFYDDGIICFDSSLMNEICFKLV